MALTKNADLISNLPVSLNAGYQSSALNLSGARGFSLQVVTTGTAAGTFILQSSNDGVNWTDIQGSTVSVAGAGNALWNVADVHYGMFRLSWTHSSGSGTLSVAKVNTNV